MEIFRRDGYLSMSLYSNMKLLHTGILLDSSSAQLGDFRRSFYPGVCIRTKRETTKLIG